MTKALIILVCISFVGAIIIVAPILAIIIAMIVAAFQTL